MTSYYTRAKARGERTGRCGTGRLDPRDDDHYCFRHSNCRTTKCVHGRAGVDVGRGGRARDHSPPAVARGRPLLRGWAWNSGVCQLFSIVGVSTLGYPSGLADPLDSAIASEGQITAESAITTATATTSSSNVRVTSRQPPAIAAEVTATAFPSPTLVIRSTKVACFVKV